MPVKVTPEMLKRAEGRLLQERARAADAYEGARGELAKQHATMTAEEARLVRERDRLAKVVSPFARGERTPDRAGARACLRYLQVCRRLGKVRAARRMAYGATLPPGEQEVGGPLG